MSTDVDAMRGTRGARNRNATRFVAAEMLAGVALLAIGYSTGLRETMHGALVSVAVFAFLPFLIAAAGIAIIVVVVLAAAMVTAITGEAVEADGGVVPIGETLVRGGSAFARRYYRALAAIRHPMFWGAIAGLPLGVLLLWSSIALFVLPGEARTVERLEAARVQIADHEASRGRVPEPDARGHLVIGDSPGPAQDGFGRPLLYSVRGRGVFTSWTLVSRGYDGRESDDDLCIEGGTRLAGLAERARAALRVIARGVGRDATIGERLSGIRAARCDRAR